MAITVSDLKTFYKCSTDAELSRTLKVSTVTLWKWETQGIPYRRQTEFQVNTKGKLKADLNQLAG